jgi:adenylosuccinate lyase
MIGPDATATLDFALQRMAGVIEKLVIYPERMQANLDRLGGLVHSQRVLLALTQAGVAREEAYLLVQRNAMKTWERNANFLDELLADGDVRAALDEPALRDLFDLGHHMKGVDAIFMRVFGDA